MSAPVVSPPNDRPDSPSAKTYRGHIHGPPTFKDKEEERAFLKFRLAQALRIFGNRGFDEGPAGHITVRDPIRPDCFWVNPFGLHFSLIQPEDLLLVSHSGEIQDTETGYNSTHGTRFRVLNTAAFMIHSAIHAARPDVLCAAHSHSTFGKAFSAVGRLLDPISQDACAFYGDHALYTQYNGIVLDDQEGSAIVEALGTKKAAILQNHGLLVATSTIEGTLWFYIAMERSCEVQLLADAATGARGGETVKINDAQAAETGRILGTQGAGWFSGSMQFMKLEAKEGVRFKFSE
ncbi:Aldolase-II domain-containing protein [Mycena chlorophos]|uniref:Aldolase-II domain-containing protein n=1 Tax=Mycena chlorophos TaxID=658473 RepID=A0A8H6S0F0_MYCCL|nr:Aldolase-II domain-containing protein [Mycena chlorophos]